MPPIELPPALPACCPSIIEACGATTDFERRMQQLLCALSSQQPDIFRRADLWRPVAIKTGPYKDDTATKWVRLAEHVEVIFFEKRSKFFQQDIGVMFDTRSEMWLPAFYDLQPGDHVEFAHNTSYRVENEIVQIGLQITQIERAKSLFVKPARSDATRRVIGAGACIV